MVLKVTHFYFPNSSDTLKFLKMNTSEDEKESNFYKDFINPDKSSASSIGVADLWLENKEYQELLEYLWTVELYMNYYLTSLDTNNIQ